MLTIEESSSNKTLSDVAHFSSQEHFDNSIELFVSENVMPLELKNIFSLSQKQVLKSSSTEVPEEEEYVDEEEELISSEILLDFLNTNNEIAIGEVFFRITEQGTFFTPIYNYLWLRELVINDEILMYCEPISSALGYSVDKGIYMFTNHENLFFFDTFRKIEPILASPDFNVEFLKSATFPSESEWTDINDGKTLAGKVWNDISMSFS